MDNFEQLESSRPDVDVKYTLFPSEHFGGCCIGSTVYINRYLSSPEKFQTLQEELAHYDYTVGDIVKEKTYSDRQQEKLARSKAMERTIPLDGLIYCYQNNIWQPSDIADHFNVTTQYLYDALQNYRYKRGLKFTYNDYDFDLTNGIKISFVPEKYKKLRKFFNRLH